MIYAIGFVQSADTKDFIDFVSHGELACFKFEDAVILSEAYKNQKSYIEKIEEYESKMVYYSNLENSIDEFIKKDKRKKVKVFFNGVSVGSGITLIGGAGVAIILLRLLL